MYKSIYLLLLGLLVTISAHGQRLFSKADLKSPVTGSPEATALGKYGDNPVSLFSGVPDISIPIYTFKAGDISVPIKLSYNAGGIRVDDIATNVGLGWTLNAGGIITRTQHGGADGTNNMQFPGPNFDPHTNAADYQTGRILVDEGKDLERDAYYYNFLSSSGKFMVNHSGKACFFPANPNIKVSMDENGPPIIITDDNGFKYFFTLLETTKNTPVCSVGIPGANEYPDETITAYYLTKIISPNNNQVDFEYEGYSYKIVKSYTEVRYEKPGLSDCPELIAQNRTCNNIQEFFGQRIKRIRSSGNPNTIEFSYSTTKRLDLKFNNIDQGNYLNHIYVKSNGINIKSWDLAYSYFGSDTNLRLKLLSVKEDDRPPYEFLYDEQHPMPERLSFSQDYWGFSNGKMPINTFIPPIPILGKISGADRNPDFEYMKSYTLKSIKYPTGGKTVFEFEPHQQYVTEEETTYVTESAILSDVSNGTVDFFLPYGSAEFKLSWGLATINSDDYMFGTILGGPGLNTVIKSVSGTGTETSFSNLLLGQTYRLSIGSSNTDDRGYISFEWKKPVTNVNAYNKILYGGLRVKNIKTYNNAELTGSKYYDYSWVNSQTGSNIVLPGSAYDSKMFYSFYSTPRVVVHSGGPVLEGSCGYNVLSASSSQSLGSALDNTLGYQQVTETSDENGANGRTIYKYYVGGLEGSKGSLVEKTDQKLIGGLYKNVFKQKNVYQEVAEGQEIIPSMKISYVQPELMLQVLIPAQFEVQKFLNISGRFLLRETKETAYDNLSSDSVSTTLNYTYNSTAHNYPTVIEKVDSRDKTMKTEKKYVNEMLSSGLPVYSAMQNANIISPVIEEKFINQSDNVQVARRLTSYKDFGNNIYQPSIVETSYGTSSPIVEIVYDQYDSHGNLLTYKRVSGPPNSYKWGYHNEYVVAEGKNASANEIFYEGFEEDNSSSEMLGTANAPAHTGFRYHLGNYTVNWNIPNSRNYVISYWYRSGGVWKLHDASPYTGSVYSLSGGDAYDDIRIYPSNAQMTTYTFSPLVGMTSKTDPKGQTTYYEFDQFQRLKFIKDQKRNAVKNYDYHYKP
jgi:hypothetical protein